ncbi:MAG: TonB family protein [Pyrinomonadaceae bacterium]
MKTCPVGSNCRLQVVALSCFMMLFGSAAKLAAQTPPRETPAQTQPQPTPQPQTPVPARQQDRMLVQSDTVKALPSAGKRWALVIGVDKYRDGQITPLTGSVNDAHKLADALVRYAGFPSDQVIVLATDLPDERQPTRSNILATLSNLAGLVPKDGLLLFSFAGHGTERGGQAFLVPTDARLSEDISLLEELAVSVTRVHDRIKATGVGQVLILLDACRNDPGGRADAPNPLSAAYTRGFSFDLRNREVQAFATIYATAVGQRAYEYTEKRQGYFTWAVVEGLQGSAANQQGEVTLAALVKYVQEVVPKRIAIDLGGGKQQRPFATIEGYLADELILAVTGPATAIAKPVEPAADPASIELSFWDSIKNSTDAADFRAYLNKYGDQGRFAPLAHNRIRQLETANKPTATDPLAKPADTTNNKPRTAIISDGALDSKALILPKPSYPPSAQSSRAAGTVIVQVTVDESGNVISAAAISGHVLLRQAAVSAARNAKFAPRISEGVAVKVTGTITYNFVAP